MRLTLRKIIILLGLFLIGFITVKAQTTNVGTGSGNGGTDNSHFGGYSGAADAGYYNSFFGQGSGKNITTGSDNSFVGHESGYTQTTASWNAFFGALSGKYNTSGNNNSFLGYGSGYSNTTGNNNSFTGSVAGRNNTTGQANTYQGFSAGYSNETGSHNTLIGINAGYLNQASRNVFMGSHTGYYNSTGGDNVFIGANSGQSNTSGSSNIYIGYLAGNTNVTGSGNIFIGNSAGVNETSSNKLFIENTSSSTPLIYGDFSSNQAGINVSAVPSGFAFAVKGKIITEELKVQLYSNWPDYVFSPDYKLKPLKILEAEIRDHGHLPEIPSAAEVKENGGFEVGEMNKKLLIKIEELTLYTIEQDKKQEEQGRKIKCLEEELKNLITEIKNK